MKQDYHVPHRSDGSWAFVDEGNTRVSSLHDTQGTAFRDGPHYLTELCEQVTDKERRHLLFTYTVHACLTSDTVSTDIRALP